MFFLAAKRTKNRFLCNQRNRKLFLAFAAFSPLLRRSPPRPCTPSPPAAEWHACPPFLLLSLDGNYEATKMLPLPGLQGTTAIYSPCKDFSINQKNFSDSKAASSEKKKKSRVHIPENSALLIQMFFPHSGSFYQSSNRIFKPRTFPFTSVRNRSLLLLSGCPLSPTSPVWNINAIPC